uniref:Uncharacterized protein n=1 Tax=Glossina palpalis gambiensis TaxID=67801 RepID=A0A1B0C3Y8_9MUSC
MMTNNSLQALRKINQRSRSLTKNVGVETMPLLGYSRNQILTNKESTKGHTHVLLLGSILFARERMKAPTTSRSFQSIAWINR